MADLRVMDNKLFVIADRKVAVQISESDAVSIASWFGYKTFRFPWDRWKRQRI